jgi:hypothetical protein
MPELLGKAIPAKELAEVDVHDFERAHVLEGPERHSRIKRKLLKAANEASTAIRGQTQTWELSEGRIKVLEVCLDGGLGPLYLGS